MKSLQLAGGRKRSFSSSYNIPDCNDPKSKGQSERSDSRQSSGITTIEIEVTKHILSNGKHNALAVEMFEVNEGNTSQS